LFWWQTTNVGTDRREKRKSRFSGAAILQPKTLMRILLLAASLLTKTTAFAESQIKDDEQHADADLQTRITQK